MVRMVRCVDSEQALELPRWRLRRSFWWNVPRRRCALRALLQSSGLGGWGGLLRNELADLYVGCTLLVTTRRDLYLDAPGLPCRRGTLEGNLQDAVLVTGVDLLLLYTFGQDHAPLE